MTDFEQQAELEQQQAEREAAAKLDAETRRLVRIQQEEAAKRDFENKMKNLGSLSDSELRQLKSQWGF